MIPPKLKANASKTFKFLQPLRKFSIFISFDVIKPFSLTDNNSVQFSNIEAILVTDVFILDKSIFFKRLFLNVEFILVNLGIFILDNLIVFKELPLNIDSILVNSCKFKPDKSICSKGVFSNIEAILVNSCKLFGKVIVFKELSLNIFLAETIEEKSNFDKSIDSIFFSPSKKLSNVSKGFKKYIINSLSTSISEFIWSFE